jgi:virulence factor Mce-like protein
MGTVLRRPWLVVLAIAVVLFGVWAYGTRQTSHHLRAVFAEAVNVFPGEDVQVDGLDAGKITSVDNADGHAVIGLGVQDDRYWPLHQGTTATLRFGTTIGNGTRYIALTPGPASNPRLPENGIITTDHTVAAVEFDEVFNTFDSSTRVALQRALRGTGGTFGPRATQLGTGVQATAPALSAVSGLAADLVRDEPALQGLVAHGSQVAGQLAGRRTQISSLVGRTAATLGAFAANTPGITGSLDLLPQTLIQTRSTLARLDASIGHLHGLITDLAPGAAQLGSLGRDLRPALAGLRKTIPIAIRTLTTGTAVSPRITRLLTVAPPFSSAAAPALTNLAPMVACIRPYSPEIAGLLSTWTSWTKNYDQIAHIGRLWGNVGPSSLTSTPLSPEAYVNTTGQGYALVRPPGYNAGQPWYLPQCDAGTAGLDPSKDPEAGH